MAIDLTLRICDSCGKIDNQARHVHNVVPGEIPAAKQTIYLAILAALVPNEVKVAALASVDDKSVQIRHTSCCAKAGCPTGTCKP